MLRGYRQQKEMSGEEFIKISTRCIDFNKSLVINLPQGLAKEIQRHYLTFLHQCNPLEFVEAIRLGRGEVYKIKFYTNEVRDQFFKYLEYNGLMMDNDTLSEKAVKQLQQFNNERIKYLDCGIKLQFLGQQVEDSFMEFLKSHTVDSKTCVVKEAHCVIFLDYKIFGLLYEEIKKRFLDTACMQVVDEAEEETAKYLKREGEEHYFYASPDEFITYVGRTTLQESSTDCTILAPMNSQENKFIPRLGYQELLTQCSSITDNEGNLVTLKEGKRIINFIKMPVARAVKVYQAIIDNNPADYPTLKMFVQELS